MEKMIISVDAEAVLSLLTSGGYQAYLVGGCVRDYLLGVAPHDYDITTNASPEQIKDLAKGKMKVEDTGLKHGTVTVYSGGTSIEVTTFREEGPYSDGRHPDYVAFVSDLEADLARRDFTINAIAYSPEVGYVDPFGGRKDLEQRLIRAVGNPTYRFDEDHLRILRALRFASTLSKNAYQGQFTIEQGTAAAVRAMRQDLLSVSRERITSEMTKLLAGKNVRGVLMKFPEVFCTLYPELQPMSVQVQHHPWHRYNLWEHVAVVVEAMEPKTEELLWAAFLHDCGKPLVAMTTSTLEYRLRPTKAKIPMEDYSYEDVNSFHGHDAAGAKLAETLLARTSIRKASQEQIVKLIAGHSSIPTPTKKAVRRWLAKNGEETARQLLALRKADIAGFSNYGVAEGSRELREVSNMLEQVLSDQTVPCRFKDLAITGHDLLDIGVPEGPKVGMLLEALFSAVVEEKVSNYKGALLAYAKEQFQI